MKMIVFWCSYLLVTVAAATSNNCPSVCTSSRCSNATEATPSTIQNADYITEGIRPPLENSVDGNVTCSSFPKCSFETFAQVYKGVRSDTLAFAARALVAANDTDSANRIFRLMLANMTNNRLGGSGSPISGYASLGYAYGNSTCTATVSSQQQGFLFDWMSISSSVANATGVQRSFPSGVPLLGRTALAGIAALAVDAKKYTKHGSSVSAMLLGEISDVLRCMKENSVFAESPDCVDDGCKQQSAARQDFALDTPIPTFQPAPVIHSKSRSRSQSISLTNSSEVSNETNTTTTTTTTTESPSTSTTLEPSTTTSTSSTTTTVIPSTTTTTTVAPTTTVTLFTTTTTTQTSTTLAPTTTTTIETTTSTTPITTTTTEAPTTTTVAPTPPPTSTPSPSPPPPNYYGLVSTQLLLRVWATGLQAMQRMYPDSLTLLQEATVDMISNATEHFIFVRLCDLARDASQQFWFPYSVDPVTKQFNTTVDVWTQCVSLAAIGTALDECSTGMLGFNVLDLVVKRFGVFGPGDKLLGFKAHDDDTDADTDVTAMCLSAATRLASDYFPSNKEWFGEHRGNLTSEDGVLAARDCYMTGKASAEVVGGAFSTSVSADCGGPLVSMRATALRYLALKEVNMFSVNHLFPVPSPTATNAPTRVPPANTGSTKGLLNVSIGVGVGAVVVIIAIAVAAKRVGYRREQREVLLQTPAANLGFY